jgi:hypothetical protein
MLEEGGMGSVNFCFVDQPSFRVRGASSHHTRGKRVWNSVQTSNSSGFFLRTLNQNDITSIYDDVI